MVSAPSRSMSAVPAAGLKVLPPSLSPVQVMPATRQPAGGVA